MSAVAPPPIDVTMGALLIGLLFAAGFQGILSMQAYIYYESFPDDSRRTKILVAGIWAIDFTHLVIIGQATYWYLVTNFGNTENLGHSTSAEDLHLVLVGLATIICQLFYVHRIWCLSKRSIPLTVFLLLGCSATLGLDITLTAILSNAPGHLFSIVNNYPGVNIAVFAVSAGVDITMSGLMCFYLWQSKTGFHRSDSIVSRIIRMVVATGLTTSLAALGGIIAYVAQPRSFIFVAIHFNLGRLYTNAVLATLNSRRSLRQTAPLMSRKSRAEITFPQNSFGDTQRSSDTGRADPEIRKNIFELRSNAQLAAPFAERDVTV